jgi:hypothetical protein
MYGMIMPFMILLMLPGAKLTSFTQGNDHIIPYMGKFLCGHQKKSWFLIGYKNFNFLSGLYSFFPLSTIVGLKLKKKDPFCP